jgi:peptide/nickel transport system ATP-binding protein
MPERDMPERDMPEPLLSVRDLHVAFRARGGPAVAVQELSFDLHRGEVLGIVGESGSGKSVSMLSVLGLVASANLEVTGSAMFGDTELLGASPRVLQDIRGRRIALVPQDPMTALTPVYTVGWHISEQLRAHRELSKKAARARAVELLGEVGIPNPERRIDNYPHEFSGGMRQRAVIAMALSCEPELIIADEPTTALDVTSQAQILDLLRRLRVTHGSSVVLITHDMGVISEMADRVLVMYAGRAVEVGPRRQVLTAPRHPYTWGLLESVPRATGIAGPRRTGGVSRRLPTIPGAPITPAEAGDGCGFASRCRHRMDVCATRPPLAPSGDVADHLDACWLRPEQKAVARRGDAVPIEKVEVA